MLSPCLLISSSSKTPPLQLGTFDHEQAQINSLLPTIMKKRCHLDIAVVSDATIATSHPVERIFSQVKHIMHMNVNT
jgi:hypothetical protein